MRLANDFLHNKPTNISAFTHPRFPLRAGTGVLICFPLTFHVDKPGGDFFRTVSQQASTVLHECCHYVRPLGSPVRLVDVAYGLPAFDGEAGKHGQHNYSQLTAEEAQRNAESFNLFAEHVTFGRDTRFGRVKDDLVAFTCGGQEFCS